MHHSFVSARAPFFYPTLHLNLCPVHFWLIYIYVNVHILFRSSELYAVIFTCECFLPHMITLLSVLSNYLSVGSMHVYDGFIMWTAYILTETILSSFKHLIFQSLNPLKEIQTQYLLLLLLLMFIRLLTCEWPQTLFFSSLKPANLIQSSSFSRCRPGKKGREDGFALLYVV